VTQLFTKPTSWFKADPNQPRKEFDEGELRRLGGSLRQKQLQPVVAKPDGTIIAGERRVRAAILVGIPELQVIISQEPLSETQLRILQLSENIHRADLRDNEKFRACVELLRLNPGWSHKDLAAHLNLAESTVSKYLAPDRAIPEVRQALEAGQVGITTVYEIAKAPPESQALLLQMSLAGESRDELAGRVRKQKQQSTPQVRVKRIVCPLPSGISVTVAGTELSLDELIDALGEAQKQAKKAREDGLDAKTFTAVLKDKARKGASHG
jgi:ParB family transcriptional regulator, chromosome partitioning protein